MNSTTPLVDNALVWFRRDLRCTDHAAFYHALKSARKVWCVFVFDNHILDKLPRQDRRVQFILNSLTELDFALKKHQQGSGVLTQYGDPAMLIPALAKQLRVQTVFVNRDDEPYSLKRDEQVCGHLNEAGIGFHSFKDTVVFEREEILTANQTPYSVFTPYKNNWLKKINDFYLKAYSVEPYLHHLAAIPSNVATSWLNRIPNANEIGFDACDDLKLPWGMSGAKMLLADFLSRMDNYDTQRDYPAVKGPSYLSTHLRFGTISIRNLAHIAWHKAEQGSNGAKTWLSELIWRDFYHQILWHHPHVVTHAFKRDYDKIQWATGTHANALFLAWCQGMTGFPLVDAAMRQLNQTGYMHNRLRMVTASFCIKDLGIDWRRGEAYFAEKLLDFDLAANNGGWQWAASSGCDAQPYFRIFNPVNQSQKFDPQGHFIRRYVPELAALSNKAIHTPWINRPANLDYPAPIVQHDEARTTTLARYAVVKSALDA